MSTRNQIIISCLIWLVGYLVVLNFAENPLFAFAYFIATVSVMALTMIFVMVMDHLTVRWLRREMQRRSEICQREKDEREARELEGITPRTRYEILRSENR